MYISCYSISISIYSKSSKFLGQYPILYYVQTNIYNYLKSTFYLKSNHYNFEMFSDILSVNNMPLKLLKRFH